MITVSIIGSGNVAQHLISAFRKADGIRLNQVLARQRESVSHWVDSKQIIVDYNQLLDADLYIIAVSDDAIAEVSNQLPFDGKLVAHTSGSTAITELSNKNRRASFYPLQTFSKNKEVDFSIIPICLESENAGDYKIIETVAKSISNTIYNIDSKQRKAIHVAAVFVNNFTNHLYQIGDDVCREHDLPFDILKPLIAETTSKIMVLSPKEAQTGPAKRNDKKTIENHLSMLTDDNQKAIYTLLTQSIQNHE